MYQFPEYICKKHNKEAPLFCKTHNTMDICGDCYHENHLECRITSMKNRTEILNIFLNDLVENKNELLGRMVLKEQELIKYISNEFQSFKSKLKEMFEKREEEVTNIFNRDDTFENNLADIENLFQSRISVKIENNSPGIHIYEDENLTKDYLFRKSTASDNQSELFNDGEVACEEETISDEIEFQRK